MNILIPVDKNDRYLSIISSIEENDYWAFIRLDSGKINKVEFYNRVEDIDCFIHNLVVINSLEYIWPFIEKNISVFIVKEEKSIDEVVESYLLKKLSELKA